MANSGGRGYTVPPRGVVVCVYPLDCHRDCNGSWNWSNESSNPRQMKIKTKEKPINI
jgi:hypothetical protein